MLTLLVKRGFGRAHLKEFFVVEKDGDVIGGIVAGPLENPEQCMQVIDALRPLHFRPLTWIAGHLSESPSDCLIP